MATSWAPLRAGSDVLFLGGLIHHVLDRGKEFRDYVVAYTNASVILPDGIEDSEDLDGLFSGWNPDTRTYDAGAASLEGSPGVDPELEHPRCVFQVLKRHFARYTPQLVEQFCGVPQARFLEIAEAFTSASGPEK